MKKLILFGLVAVVLAVATIVIGFHSANADYGKSDAQLVLAANEQQAAPTLRPTAPPMVAPGVTATATEARILPPVGSNAGLVLAASVLVFIIIGGVLGARSRQKH